MADRAYIIGPTITTTAGGPFPHDWERSKAVEACPHAVWENCLLEHRGGSFEEVIRCADCHAPRCGSSTDDDPCLLVRHHGEPHVFVSGRRERVGGGVV